MNQEKNDEMDTMDENTKNLERIAKELDEARTDETGVKLDVCAEYKKIKPILEKALPFIRFIPKWGKQVADAIEMVMGIADKFCT